MRRCLLFVLLAACSGDPTPACRGAPHVCGGQLRDADGRAWILRGLNLSGEQKLPPYLGFQGRADYLRVRDEWGMNGLRFVMPWAAVEPSAGVYDDAYLDQVAQRLAWAREAGLAVVVDMHQDVYGEGFGFDGAPRWTCSQARYDAFVPRTMWFLNYSDPNVIACFDDFYAPALRARFVAAWRHVAARLAASDAVIGLDPLNEPFWGSSGPSDFEPSRLGPLYAEVVAAVRAEAPGWVAFVEPSAARNLGLPTALLPFDFADVVYAPHAYDQQAEGGMGFDPSHRPAYLGKFMELRAEADLLGAALWIGEYGTSAATSGLADYMDAAYAGAGAAAAGSMYWDYSRGGYGILATDGSLVTGIADAIVRPFPTRIAGDPVDYAYDAATRTLTVRYHADAMITAPTEISVPARAYPNGVVVACGGCTSAVDGARVSILTPPPGDPAVVIVTPHP